MNEEGVHIGNHCYWPPALYAQHLLVVAGDNSGDGYSHTWQYISISMYYSHSHTVNDIRYL